MGSMVYHRQKSYLDIVVKSYLLKYIACFIFAFQERE